VIQAAMLSPLVQTVITLASQSYGADFAAQLAPQCSLLLLHGTDDQILSPNCSRYLYAIAQEPKRLILYPGARHSLDGVSDQVSQAVYDWTIGQLNPKR
jgi:alpha-beta hydrolase superfamily lysophospholipase